ncbi:hypothetical protein S245_032638, partial [Arachis hypogaea]
DDAELGLRFKQQLCHLYQDHRRKCRASFPSVWYPLASLKEYGYELYCSKEVFVTNHL